jgi:hypothetical protein
MTCKETLWHVFFCLRPRTQYPSPTNLDTCIHYNYTYSHREGGGRELSHREGYRGNSSQNWVENTNMTNIQKTPSIYAPMIYTAPYVMFLMRADPLRGQVGGGWALEIETFLGTEMATSEASPIRTAKSLYRSIFLDDDILLWCLYS